MSKQKTTASHTPGPWYVHAVRDVECNWNGAETDTAYFIGGPHNYQNEFEQEANKALIAAAPELLEAAHTALKLIRGSGFTENTKALIELKAAINKAEGNSNE